MQLERSVYLLLAIRILLDITVLYVFFHVPLSYHHFSARHGGRSVTI